jgi:hypothetical protein
MLPRPASAARLDQNQCIWMLDPITADDIDREHLLGTAELQNGHAAA